MIADKSTEGIQKHRILIIDDDPAILEELSIFLRRKNFDVFTAAVPALGLQMFLEHKPDLVLLDVRMPGMSGQEVLMRIKQKPGMQEVILISGTINNKEAMQLLELGAYTFIAKPVDLFFLLHMIQRALELMALKKEIQQLRTPGTIG